MASACTAFINHLPLSVPLLPHFRSFFFLLTLSSSLSAPPQLPYSSQDSHCPVFFSSTSVCSHGSCLVPRLHAQRKRYYILSLSLFCVHSFIAIHALSLTCPALKETAYHRLPIALHMSVINYFYNLFPFSLLFSSSYTLTPLHTRSLLKQH